MLETQFETTATKKVSTQKAALMHMDNIHLVVEMINIVYRSEVDGSIDGSGDEEEEEEKK